VKAPRSSFIGKIEVVNWLAVFLLLINYMIRSADLSNRVFEMEKRKSIKADCHITTFIAKSSLLESIQKKPSATIFLP